MDDQIARIRTEYARHALTERDVDPDPFAQFQTWLAEAIEAALIEPTAMTLATASRDARPSARVVLLKGFDRDGAVFYTNYESRKGRELAENPVAALGFFWPELQRQVRIEGAIERVDAEQSDAYFASRPAGSRLGAAASPQSAVLADRDVLERRVAELLAEYPDGQVPRPEHWGGYRLTPDTFEFWQGRPSRLHDRIRYRLDAGRWLVERLAP